MAWGFWSVVMSILFPVNGTLKCTIDFTTRNARDPLMWPWAYSFYNFKDTTWYFILVSFLCQPIVSFTKLRPKSLIYIIFFKGKRQEAYTRSKFRIFLNHIRVT